MSKLKKPVLDTDLTVGQLTADYDHEQLARMYIQKHWALKVARDGLDKMAAKEESLGNGSYWPFSRVTDSGLVGSIFLLCVTAIILFCIFTWFTLPLLLGDW